MSGSLDFEFSFSNAKQTHTAHSDQAMRILILGDFSGLAQRKLEDSTSLVTRSIRNIDIDNFEQIMERMSIGIRLNINDVEMDISVSEMDDFHPDELYQSLDIFKTLKATRDDPSTSDSAFADLLGGSIVGGSTVGESAENTSNKNQSDNAAQSVINNLIKDIFKDQPAAAPNRDEHKAAVDAASAEVMRTVLHDPAFSSIESTWLSLHQLVTNLELDENLQLHILDVSKQELEDDLSTAGEALDTAALYKLLVERNQQSPDSEPWSMIIGNYTFDTSETDVAMLAAIGAIGAQAGAPFIAAASPNILGCDTLSENTDADTWSPLDEANAARWQALRTSSSAQWIGLACPRLLQRQPYGANSDPIDQFSFEEMPDLPRHNDFLWGNAAFGCALLMARSFAENGWEMNPGDELDIDDLPAYSWQHEDEVQMQACAEVFTKERTADAILAKGLMPFLSFKNRNAVRLLRSQSIAHPSQALSGPW